MWAKKCFWVFMFGLVFILGSSQLAAAQPSAAQTSGGILQQEKAMDIQKKLEEKIYEPKKDVDPVVTDQIVTDEDGPQVLIVSIEVEGYTLLTEDEVRTLVGPFENQELSLDAMQKIADLITDEYRKRGYPTSRAYLPPQQINKGVLIIQIVEGKLGKIEIRGNKYFKTSTIERKIDLRPYGLFDYASLQRSLISLNEHPDRFARVVLVPGTESGTTDVIVNVEDRSPIHFVFEYDNYSSRYLNEDRYSGILEHNNLSGHDDKLRLIAQFGESELLSSAEGRYLYPLSTSLEAGAYFTYSKTRLAREFIELEARGEAQTYGVFLSQILTEGEAHDLRLNLGFDYKSMRNELLGVESSHDEVRVLKAGLDLDLNDRFGRTILTLEGDFGIPDFMGAMEAKDASASRVGAGSKFQKGVMNLFRLQPTAFGTSLLWKNSAQFSNHRLVAGEQFQIGGPTSVRGYPVGEFSGDKGYYTALELSIPPYWVDKQTQVFFSDVKLYNAMRFVIFYDWATVNIKNLGVGEAENQVLHGIGAGMRFNVKNDLAFRLELGHPLGKAPSDGDKIRPWVEFTWRY